MDREVQLNEFAKYRTYTKGLWGEGNFDDASVGIERAIKLGLSGLMAQEETTLLRMIAGRRSRKQADCLPKWD